MRNHFHSWEKEGISAAVRTIDEQIKIAGEAYQRLGASHFLPRFRSHGPFLFKCRAKPTP
jgi:hypothetical protein